MRNKIQTFALVAIMLCAGIYACQKTNNNESFDSKTVTAEATSWVKDSPDNFSISDAKSYLQAKITLAEANKGSFLDKYKFSDLKVKFEDAKCYKKGDFLYLVVPFTLNDKDLIICNEKENPQVKYEKGSNARLIFVRDKDAVVQVNTLMITSSDKLDYSVFDFEKNITNITYEETYYTIRGRMNQGWVHTKGKVTHKISDAPDDNTLQSRGCTLEMNFVTQWQQVSVPTLGYYYEPTLTFSGFVPKLVCQEDIFNQNGTNQSSSFFNGNVGPVNGGGGGPTTTSGANAAFTGKTITANEVLCPNSMNQTTDMAGNTVTKFKGIHLGLEDGTNRNQVGPEITIPLGYVSITSGINRWNGDGNAFLGVVAKTYNDIRLNVQQVVSMNSNITQSSINSDTRNFPNNTSAQEYIQILFDGLFRVNYSRYSNAYPASYVRSKASEITESEYAEAKASDVCQ
jgi:hypothetical protein